jgi:hypothetical protein
MPASRFLLFTSEDNRETEQSLTGFRVLHQPGSG